MLFIESAGVLIDTSKHLDAAERNALTVELMSHEAVDTSAIEGEPLDRDSVQSSSRRHLGLAGDHRRASPAEAGIAEMMVDLYEQASAPLTEAGLVQWHRLMTNGRTDLHDIGRYRTHTDPMQIVSGALHAPKVHFGAPPPSQPAFEMQRSWDWLQRRCSHQTGRPAPPRLDAQGHGSGHAAPPNWTPRRDDNGTSGAAPRCADAWFSRRRGAVCL